MITKNLNGAGRSSSRSRSANVGEPPPNPEVVPTVPKARRRTFTAEHKLRIVQEADACKKPGEVGALCRREGIYSSLLSDWRRQRDAGFLGAPRARGPKPTHDARDREIEQLKRDKTKLEERLRIAELICEAQKKVAEILGITLPKRDDEQTS